MKRLEAQAHDTAPIIREIAAANPRLRGETHWMLLRDPNYRVRRAAIMNPSATIPMYEDRLLFDADDGIKAYASLMLFEADCE